MLLARVRHFADAHHHWWCVAGLVLALLQPFIAVHFRADGLEDEPMLRVRSASDTTQFEADDRASHPRDRETTLFAQTPASIDLPNTFIAGLTGLMTLVLLSLPLRLAMGRFAPPVAREVPEPVPRRSGSPPPTAPWRRLPPTTAPPSFPGN